MHPPTLVVNSGGSALAPQMLQALIVAVIAFTLLYVYSVSLTRS